MTFPAPDAPGWLYRHWLAGAFGLSVGLLAVAPWLAHVWSRPLLLIFAFLPAYGLHQAEEHYGDRFRRFVNDRVFGGRAALTRAAVLWINLPGVWGLNLAALAAARWLGPGAGLAAPYLAVVNAAGHVAGGVRLRGYNPGLLTAAGLFLPLGVLTLAAVPATMAQHLAGLGVALAMHGAIIAAVAVRLARLPAGGAGR